MSRPSLVATVWRWHFYAGLLTIPFIVILCLSGIVYLFKPQIDAAAWGELRTVQEQPHRATYAAQLAAVGKAYPDAIITQLAPPPDSRRASEVDLIAASGQELRVYVDPYRAEVLGDREPRKSLTTIALELHGALLTTRFLDDAGRPGDRILELVSSWAVVLVLTGHYLWWPRGRRGFRDAFRPRLRSKSSRTRWRDVHAVTGVTFSFITLFFLITGLAWTGIWGTKFAEFSAKTGESFPEGLYDGASSRTFEDTVRHGKPAWAAAELPVASSSVPIAAEEATAPVAAQGKTSTSGSGHTHTGDTVDHGNHAASQARSGGSGSGSVDDRETAGELQRKLDASAGRATGSAALTAADVKALRAGRSDVEVRPGADDGHDHVHPDLLVWDPRKGAPIDAIVGRAAAMGFPPGMTIAFPIDETDSYTLSRFPDADVDPNAKAGDERITYVDQYTAMPIRDHKYQDFGVVAQATDLGIALHEGRQWGLASQLLTLIGTLAILLSCATAVVMWRKRRRKGIGAPRRPPNRKLGIGVVVITLGLGLLFPLLGLSIVALLVFDFVIVRHVPPLARALGAR